MLFCLPCDNWQRVPAAALLLLDLDTAVLIYGITYTLHLSRTHYIYECQNSVSNVYTYITRIGMLRHTGKTFLEWFGFRPRRTKSQPTELNPPAVWHL